MKVYAARSAHDAHIANGLCEFTHIHLSISIQAVRMNLNVASVCTQTVAE